MAGAEQDAAPAAVAVKGLVVEVQTLVTAAEEAAEAQEEERRAAKRRDGPRREQGSQRKQSSTLVEEALPEGEPSSDGGSDDGSEKVVKGPEYDNDFAPLEGEDEPPEGASIEEIADFFAERQRQKRVRRVPPATLPLLLVCAVHCLFR